MPSQCLYSVLDHCIYILVLLITKLAMHPRKATKLLCILGDVTHVQCVKKKTPFISLVDFWVIAA